MLNVLLKELKKILSDSHNAIIGAILGALFIGAGGVFLFFEKQWILLKSILLSPTPLWATIATALAAYLYIHIRFRLFRSSIKDTIDIITELIPAEGFKWETKIKNKKVYHISEIPLCPKHELKLSKFDDKYACMDNDCKLGVDIPMLEKIYEVAASHIERYVRNKYN